MGSRKYTTMLTSNFKWASGVLVNIQQFPSSFMLLLCPMTISYIFFSFQTSSTSSYILTWEIATLPDILSKLKIKKSYFFQVVYIEKQFD